MLKVVGRADTVQCLKAVWGFEVIFLVSFFFSPLVMRPLLLLVLAMGPWFLSLQGVCPAQPVYFVWR